MRRTGVGPRLSLNLWPPFSPIEHYGREVARLVEEALAATGTPQVDIVAHSMGGLAARYYIQELGGSKKVRRLITLGTPHRGALRAGIGVGENARQMVPGSDFLCRLNSPGSGAAGELTVCFYSPLDNMVVPARSAVMEGCAEEIRVDRAGHNTLLVSRRVASMIARLLLTT